MSYECHITCHQADAAVATSVAEALHWKTSEIARDPVLGQATYFYLTSHGKTFEHLFGRMREAVAALKAKGLEVVREKIEHIVFDTKLGIGVSDKEVKTEESTRHPPEADRANFEDQVYNAYFRSQIRRTGLGGPLELMAHPDTKDKAVLMKRDPEALFSYEDDGVSAMWFGWCLAAKHGAFSDPNWARDIESMRRQSGLHERLNILLLKALDAVVDHPVWSKGEREALTSVISNARAIPTKDQAASAGTHPEPHPAQAADQ